MEKKGLIIASIAVVVLFLEFYPKSYTYCTDAVANFVRTHAENRSVGLCARYVRLAIEGGGCPTYGFPGKACEYHDFLKELGFQQY